MTTFHVNGHDGRIHVHDCPDHPVGTPAGGSACYWEEHSTDWWTAHKSAAVSNLIEQQDQPSPGDILGIPVDGSGHLPAELGRVEPLLLEALNAVATASVAISDSFATNAAAALATVQAIST